LSEVLPPNQLRDEARTLYRQGDFQAAVNLFLAAENGYKLAGDSLTAAEMANDRCVVLLLSGEPQRALEAVSGTDQVFASAGDFRRQAISLGNQGDVLEALKRSDEAMLSYEKAAELFKQAGEYELRAYVMKSISSLQFRKGRVWEALGTMYAGIEAIPNPSPSQRILKRLLSWPLKRLTGIKK
jgi:tetratricopeptide (TPR) repeat protein